MKKGTTMHPDDSRPVHNLSDEVIIKRWKVTGTVVARKYSPLCYDIQCARKLHRNVPAKWVVPVTEKTSNVIRLVA